MFLFLVLSFNLSSDVNDNNPYFVQSPDIVIPENTTAGTVIGRVVGADADSANITQLSYQFLRNSDGFLTYGIFSLDSQSGVITLIGSLDRESRFNYSLRIEVRDGGGRSATEDITVEVSDINDNLPVFSSLLYSGTINEAALASTMVVQVSASDQDVSRFNIRYTIVSGNVGSVFDINATSGVIFRSNTGVIDYESRRRYDLTVEAEDSADYSGAGIRRRAQAQVVISVTDANDNDPIFVATLYTGAIDEHSTGDVSVLTVRATDRDSGTNAELVYSIVGGDGEDNFTINSMTGMISSPPVLDYEVASQLTLIVQVEDMGSPPRTSPQNATVVIDIRNLNDNAPQFVNAPYFTQVDESADGVVVFDNVIATDADEPVGPQLTFSIFNGNEASHFLIIPTTGEVLLNGSQLNILNQRTYILTLEVQDGGNPPLNAFTTLEITVLDANNHPPVFSQNAYTANISELSTSGASVLTVLATDRDEMALGNVTYRLFGTRASYFNIDPISGEITLSSFGASQIDYDESVADRTLAFEAQALDQGAMPLTANVSVFVFLFNENDNTPEFLPPGETSISATIPEKETVGSVIGSVSATDRDPGDDALLRYTVVSGNAESRFMLNATTGVLTLAASVNFEGTTFYRLNVSVSDAGMPIRRSYKTIQITVVSESLLGQETALYWAVRSYM